MIDLKITYVNENLLSAYFEKDGKVYLFTKGTPRYENVKFDLVDGKAYIHTGPDRKLYDGIVYIFHYSNDKEPTLAYSSYNDKKEEIPPEIKFVVNEFLRFLNEGFNTIWTIKELEDLK